MNKFAQSLPPVHLLRKFGRRSPRPTNNQHPFCFHPSWRSLFFYLCTDDISFAPLKSQGEEYRLAYIFGAPLCSTPPCSPKSIYVLAGLVRSFFGDTFLQHGTQ